ncbi:hypothetical protein F5Y19DRAFT_451034 [Xylariaceae sp. FL1651]|nr:hypothetical protein F5Y19DRAFT_451034 [Xylariaceae sp. FL1651]
MSAPTNRDEYSTLEVAEPHQYGQYPEVAPSHSGQYPEVAPSQLPESYGYYEPHKTEQTTPQTYSTYPEVVDNGANSKSAAGAESSPQAKICGIRRKYFWFALAASILIIIGVVIGVVVGVVTNRSSSSSHNVGGNGTGEGNGPGASNATSPSAVTIYENTRLASANFTDMYGYDNFLLVYQASNYSIYMSAFNSSNNKWVVSPVVDGKDGNVKLGTSLALDTFWQGTDASPDVTLYYQTSGPTTTIMSVSYSHKDNLSTTSVAPSANWKSVAAASSFNSLPGSSLAAYGKQCAYCNQYTYFYWQGAQGIFSAEDDGSGFNNAAVVDVTTAPSANTSFALAHSGTLTGDQNAILRRSINLFYRSMTSQLTQLRIGNGMNVPHYVGRDIGPLTNFAAFSTGFNESNSDNPTPLGFQVLSIDPDGNDGVQLTYLKGNDWTAATDEVTDLADCQAKATMAANIARRLYCLVDSGGNAGVQIMEWAWQGDPSNTDTYLKWKKVGAVNTGL